MHGARERIRQRAVTKLGLHPRHMHAPLARHGHGSSESHAAGWRDACSTKRLGRHTLRSTITPTHRRAPLSTKCVVGLGGATELTRERWGQVGEVQTRRTILISITLGAARREQGRRAGVRTPRAREGDHEGRTVARWRCACSGNRRRTMKAEAAPAGGSHGLPPSPCCVRAVAGLCTAWDKDGGDGGGAAGWQCRCTAAGWRGAVQRAVEAGDTRRPGGGDSQVGRRIAGGEWTEVWQEYRLANFASAGRNSELRLRAFRSWAVPNRMAAPPFRWSGVWEGMLGRIWRLGARNLIWRTWEPGGWSYITDARVALGRSHIPLVVRSVLRSSPLPL